MKIKFFLNGLVLPRGTTSAVVQDSLVTLKSSGLDQTPIKKDNVGKSIPLYVNPNYWYLRHFYNLHGKSNSVEWLMPELFKIYNLDECIKIIKDELPDVLCLSMFVWNYNFNLQLACKIKQLWPTMKIIMGGPELIAHKQPGFFVEHPYVDFVVYGDGEQAFTQLIDYFLGIAVDKTQWINIVENQAGKDVVYPYETLSDQLFFSTSPYISQKEFILASLKYNSANLRNYYHDENYNFMIGMEFARGCMYSCTFCDWSQNLTKKVKRGKRDFFKDVDFFYDNDLVFNETDANFGQWDEDLEIFDYALGRYDKSRNFKFVVTNTPKLKKSATEHIVKKQLQYYDGDFLPTVALQDTDDRVLKNIDRPSFSLEEQFELINNIKKDVPREKFANLAIQLIIGLPGQQLDTCVNGVVEIISNTGVSKFTVGLWELLSNSPANDKFYQSVHKLKFEKVFSVNKIIDNCDLDTFYKDAANNGQTNPLYTCSESVIIKNSHLDWWDILTLHHFYGLVSSTPYLLFENKTRDQIEKIVNRLFKISVAKIQGQKILHEPLINQYNVRLLNFYDSNNRRIWKI
jgi:hypothetical protein